MYKLLLAAHVLVAVFAIGPLAQAAAAAARGIRKDDASALTGSARTVRIYSYASLFVVLLGFAVVGAGKGVHQHKLGEAWIGISILLWLGALGLGLFVLVPSLSRASALVGSGKPAAPLTGRVAASGGIIAVLFAAVVVLMVYRPGQ